MILKKEVELLEAVKREVQRLDNLVNNFFGYARPLALKKQQVDAEKLFGEIVDLFKVKAEAAGIEIRTEFSYMPNLMADPDLLKTAIMNIIKNSFEAMPQGGILTLKTGREEGRAYIEISDTGGGIPEEYMERIFDPFFTTKRSGLGLGLSTTKRIIEEHGGTISVKSRKTEGTTVKITFHGEAS